MEQGDKCRLRTVMSRYAGRGSVLVSYGTFDACSIRSYAEISSLLTTTGLAFRCCIGTKVCINCWICSGS